MNFVITRQTREVPSKAGCEVVPVPLHRASGGSHQESHWVKGIRDRVTAVSLALI